MILATDELYTYAIFNYADITWSSHTEAGGDTTGGEGGVPAYVRITLHTYIHLSLIDVNCFFNRLASMLATEHRLMNINRIRRLLSCVICQEEVGRTDLGVATYSA